MNKAIQATELDQPSAVKVGLALLAGILYQAVWFLGAYTILRWLFRLAYA